MKNSSSRKRVEKIPFSLRLLRLTYNTVGRLFPIYFGNRAYQQWFTTVRFKTPAFEKLALTSAREESITVNGVAVVVYIWQHETIAPDKTLLFVHGWTGRGTQIAYYIKKLNALGYRIISFDGIAHGKTAGKQTSAYEMADTVLALDKQYGKFDAVITHSFSGMILAYAMSLGMKADHVVLICPPTGFPDILKNFQRILALPDSVMRVVIRKSFITHGQVSRDAVDTLNNVKNLQCKGLVIHDEDDTDISWRSGEKVAEVWPHAKFIKTRGLGHRRIIRDDEVVDHIVKFLSTTE